MASLAEETAEAVLEPSFAEPVVLESVPIPLTPPKKGPKRGKAADKEEPFATQAAKDSPLSKAEQDTFATALQEMFSLLDTGLWHLGLDTDTDMPTRTGEPGEPIWELDDDEAAQLTKSFMALGAKRAQVFVMMRLLNESYYHLLSGLILSSRFLETGIRIFETGINFRLSKTAWQKSIDRTLKGDS